MDGNATTAVAPEVAEAMSPFFGPLYGNPSSMHAFGGQVSRHLEKAREEVAAFINADPCEIVFTSCATESDNTAIRSAAESLGTGATIITTAVEHPAVLRPCRRLKESGFRVVELPVDRLGRLDMGLLGKALNEACGKAFVSAMWANNETGVVFPVREIAALCREHGALFHTDAVQAAGKVRIDVRETPVDYLAISGHKFHAPKGVGALYVRRGAPLRPLLLGGHQESGRRAGTENVAFAAALAKACTLAADGLEAENARIAALRDRLEAGILAACPDSFVNGDRENRLSNTLNVAFPYIEGEAIAYRLSDLGICVSTGSACASGSLDPSHVMRAMGVPFIALHGSVRFSLTRYNTDADIDYVLEKLPPAIAALRKLSPFGPDSDPTTFK